MKVNETKKETLVTVIGTGYVTVPNDKVDVEISFRKEAKTVGESSSQILSKIDDLKSVLAKGNFNPTKFNAGNLNVAPKTKQVKNPDGTYTWTRDGFEASATCELSFSISKNANWASVIDSVLSSVTDCSLNIRFGYEDEKEIKQNLIERAVKDALDKIDDIASSASKKLDNIVSIEEVVDPSFAVRPMALAMRSSAETLDQGESRASISVKVVASLKAK